MRSGFCAVVGRPNVGKSTLVNRMVGSKVAITSSRPQTTRNVIRGVLTGDDFQLVLVDTPGLHKPRVQPRALVLILGQQSFRPELQLRSQPAVRAGPGSCDVGWNDP